MKALYQNLCLNCRSTISDERLIKIGVCETCLEKIECKNLKKILQSLKEKNKLYFAEEIFLFQNKFIEFSNFFKKALAKRMWSLQETWAKRILLNNNFSIVAPTGVGKTILGVVSALYFSVKGKKSYIIVPTALLVQQIAERIDLFSNRLNIKPRVVCYHAGMNNKERKDVLEKIKQGDFEILVTTERFLINRFNFLRNKTFHFTFVDDVDSFLKSPKNIDRIMILLGFNEEIIEKAMRIIELRKEANRLKRMKKPFEHVLEEIENLRKQIENYKNQNNIGLLVVSGATLKARRTKRIKLFEELLNFQIGFKPEFLRNIKDFYLPAEENLEKHVFSIIKRFGGGCLVFVPSVFGKRIVNNINTFLNANGIKSYAYTKMDEKMLEKFRNGEYDVLVGVASFRSPLARGIDIPERIRYVIFAGVPRSEIKLSWEECNPIKILTLLKNLKQFLSKEAQDKANQLINIFRRIMPVSKQTIERVKEALEKNSKLDGFDEYLRKVILDAQDFLKKEINQKVIEEISKSKEVSIKQRDNTFYLVVADSRAYVQASGRASRLFAGGISRGASFILVDDEKAFYSLKKQLEFLLEGFSFLKFNLKNTQKWFKKIDEDREIIKNINEGKISKRIKDFIKTALLIVESPTKARTIAKFFGKPFKRKFENMTIFEISTGKYVLNIAASMGHIYDLVVNQGFHGVKIENKNFIPIYDFIKKCKKCGEQFTGLDFCPKCKSQELYSKKQFIDVIRKIALEVNSIFIATDPDIEGEKIAYDIYCSLYPINKNIKRLEFHEITKKAFLQAIKQKRKINIKMVEAQLVRRIEDRWIGFELSKKLWQRFKNNKLSAGRVQTPVLGWIIQRVNESKKKKKILLAKLSNGLKVSIENPNFPFPIKRLNEQLKNIKAKIMELKTEQQILLAPKPYTTDTLLREASAKLGFSAAKTMTLAQDLFEVGLCTYHRTDSTTVSSVGINIAKEYINEKYPSLFSPHKYATKGAHECIRPTRPIDVERLKNLISLGILRFPKKLTQEHFKLYDLIFKRFIASQMKETKLLYQKFKIFIDGNKAELENPISIIEQGFNVLFPIKLMTPIQEGEYNIVYGKILVVPAAKWFTQGEIISLMKEKGIGRPSTYAKIISTILERKYVVEHNNRLVNTPLGFKVYLYLSKNFNKFASEETTRKLESLMDLVEQGEANYNEILENLFKEILEIRKVK